MASASLSLSYTSRASAPCITRYKMFAALLEVPILYWILKLNSTRKSGHLSKRRWKSIFSKAFFKVCWSVIKTNVFMKILKTEFPKCEHNNRSVMFTTRVFALGHIRISTLKQNQMNLSVFVMLAQDCSCSYRERVSHNYKINTKVGKACSGVLSACLLAAQGQHSYLQSI